MAPAAYSSELSTIDQPHDGHPADTEQIGGLLGAEYFVGREHDRLGARLQNLHQAKERVTSRIGRIIRVACRPQGLVKRSAKAHCLIVCDRPSHDPSLAQTPKTHTITVAHPFDAEPPSHPGDIGGEEVDAVSVEFAARSVVVLGGSGVGVASEDLRVAEGDTGVEGVGDGCVPQ
jgi:hypothetical protein